MPFVTTANAVDRETAWLQGSGDGLPALLIAAGGRWDVVGPYQPRTPNQSQSQLYVQRRALKIERFGMIRRMAHYEFALCMYWPFRRGDGNAEGEQRSFDLAIDDVLTRVGGLGPPLADKTHGGRFLSVAEDPTQIDLRYTPAATTFAALVNYEAEITYWADDFDFNG